MTRSAAGLGVLLLLSGCSDSTGPGDACLAETTHVDLTVTAGASPVFGWSPACPVAILGVEKADGTGSDMWFASTPEASWTLPDSGNLLRPSITYGQAPAGSSTTRGPEPLVSGASYNVFLWRVLPAGSQAQCAQRMNNMCMIALKVFSR